MNTKTTRACECGLWRTEPDGNGTGCTAATRRLYAQGHDARFASWLAQQQATGQQVRRGDGVPVTPAEAAATVGLGYDIAAKAARLGSRKPRKTREPAGPEPGPQPVRVKIGRWEQTAVIDPDGTARYTNRSGDQKTAPVGSYKVLATVGGGDR